MTHIIGINRETNTPFVLDLNDDAGNATLRHIFEYGYAMSFYYFDGDNFVPVNFVKADETGYGDDGQNVVTMDVVVRGELFHTFNYRVRGDA